MIAVSSGSSHAQLALPMEQDTCGHGPWSGEVQGKLVSLALGKWTAGFCAGQCDSPLVTIKATVVTMMKLGLFLFLQLKDGTLTSGVPEPCSTSQALCVWPLSTRRGLNHHSSWTWADGVGNTRRQSAQDEVGKTWAADHRMGDPESVPS